jgi:universal stress protein E
MNRFKNILVVATQEEVIPALLARAAALARMNDARLTLLGFVETPRTPRRVLLDDGEEIGLQHYLERTRREELQDFADAVGGVEVDVDVAGGIDFVEVVRHVVQNDHDLVIAEAQPAGRRTGLAGASMTMHLLRKCPVPVWVESGDDTLSDDVAVAVGPFEEAADHDALTVMLLELGSSLAALRGGTLHVVHAWRLVGETLLRRGRHRPPADQVDAMVEDAYRAAERSLNRLISPSPEMGTPIKRHLVKGDPGTVVPEVLETLRPGVVVMGTLARAGLKGVFVGNTAERVLGSIDVPVLAVKPPGFETPLAV